MRRAATSNFYGDDVPIVDGPCSDDVLIVERLFGSDSVLRVARGGGTPPLQQQTFNEALRCEDASTPNHLSLRIFTSSVCESQSSLFSRLAGNCL